MDGYRLYRDARQDLATLASTTVALALLLIAAGCSRGSPASTKGAEPTNVAANVAAPVADQNMAVPDEPTVAAAEPAPIGPDDDFLDGCVVGAIPTGGLVRIGDVRAGDLVATVANGSDDTGWEPDGERRFIFRTNNTDKLTQTSKSVAVRLRLADVAPVKAAICGPQAVVVEGMAVGDKAASPIEAYVTTKQLAARAARLRDNGSLGALDYREKTPVQHTGPYTEQLVSEAGAMNRAIAVEAGKL